MHLLEYHGPVFCDGFESGECTSWSTMVPRLARKKADRMFAGVGAMGGVVLIGFLLGGGMRTRGGRAFMLALFFVTAGFTAAACSSSDSGVSIEETTPTEDETVALTCDSVEEGQQCREVTGFEPNTTFFWKVVASDDVGGSLESEVRSFTTGD